MSTVVIKNHFHVVITTLKSEQRARGNYSAGPDAALYAFNLALNDIMVGPPLNWPIRL